MYLPSPRTDRIFYIKSVQSFSELENNMQCDYVSKKKKEIIHFSLCGGEIRGTVRACFTELSKKEGGIFKLCPFSMTDLPIYTHTIIQNV